MNPFLKGFSEGILPPEPITVSQWSDSYRQLSSRASLEHGLWRTSRTPYLKEPMDCLGTQSKVQRVVTVSYTHLTLPTKA